MIQFVMRHDVAEFVADMGTMRRKQLPFALERAINRTAEEARDAVRERVYRIGFAIRSAQSRKYIQSAIILERAARTKQGGRQYSRTLLVESKVGRSKSRSLLPWLEEGGMRTSPREIGPPGVFGRAVAVPLRNSPMDRVDRRLYPAGLRLQQSRYVIEGNDGGGFVAGRLKGKRRTFLLPARSGTAGRGVILQRTGPKRHDVRPLFLVTPQVPVRGRHYFLPTVQRTWDERFMPNLRGMLDAALFSGEIGRRRGVRVRFDARSGTMHPTQAW